MNLSMKWLSDYIQEEIPVKEFCHCMTMSGSKVEGFETEGSSISKVVVGKILSIAPHENADALFVCQVEIGAEAPVQIVTNARNVKPGDLVPLALDGATLPEGKIKKCKMRGVESFGMFCGLETLGLTVHDFPYADPDGVLVIQEPCQVGEDIHSALGLNDTSVEFEITSNRPDCLSVIGLAREAAATFHVPLHLHAPAFHANSESISEQLSVEVQNTTLCPRYCAGMVKNVKIGPSPRWMRERLRASGVRPINNLVDITNYVMLEYGQPMHAFDLRYVQDAKITVRNAKDGEQITTLDGTERNLSPEMLVIADSEKPIAVAGVMGGEYSGIMEDTTTVVFESAYFEPTQVRLTAKKLGMRTDASARYEKGLDPNSTITVLSRAFELVEQLGAGEVVGGIIDVNNVGEPKPPVPFDANWINGFLGTNIPESDMIHYLNELHFKVEDGMVYAPSFRIDIECKADVAEEIARIYGYNNIPSTELQGLADARLTPAQIFNRQIEQSMVALGCYEIAAFSFVSPKYFDKIALPADSKLRKPLVITNPLGEDTSVMRTTALPSMLEILARNYNNRNESARLFEIGKEYLPTTPDQLPLEPARLTIGMYGGNVDFYDLKGVIEALMVQLKISGCRYERCGEDCPFDEKSAFHPGRSAVLYVGDTPLGIFGELHPNVQNNYGIGVKTYAAKLNIPEMLEHAATEISYQPLPKYPATTRDLSLVCDDGIPVAQLEQAIRKAVGNILEKVTLFDVYKGQQIAQGKKSVSYSISMRSHDGTLTDEQADGAMKRVLKALKAMGAELRM
ncbi:phenylalanine--tRNA ligase subunit beta [Ruminococcus champanellensis]|uniref:phenylalanine--tRNA ligase subunit beta n=1 Tax=Ruminococcus champanellensis TaxID=1161942 RepID=UPI0023F2531B|nr:phenylalanine--tRNA ligase subunit beta [Ruminococcus champanellensis]